MWRVSSEVEEAMWAAVRSQLPERSRKHKALVPAIASRSAMYTVAREELAEKPQRVSANDDLAARALFFTLADAAKIGVPVAELSVRGLLPGGDPLRVLDLGAGCGAMSVGIIDRLPDRRIEITAVDTDRSALAIMAEAVKTLDGGRGLVGCETQVGSVLRGATSTRRHDLVVAGSLLNELDESRAAALAGELIELVTDDGALIIIEPATRELSRRLHRVRDQIIAKSLGHVFAPCTRAGAPCPALADERDWCHEDRPFAPTPRLAALTRATGMRTKHLKFSYLVVRRAPATVAPRSGLLRVVSSLKKKKGQTELYGCGADGRHKLRLQKRDRSEATKPFERARRGDLLEVGEGRYTVIDPTGVR